MAKLRVGLLFGGRSVEHEVSLSSATSIYNALDKERYEVTLIGIDPDPEKIEMGMPIEVVFKDALGRKDRDGNSYLSYFFQPRG